MLYLKIASDKQGKKKDGKNWWMIILLHFFFFFSRGTSRCQLVERQMPLIPIVLHQFTLTESDPMCIRVTFRHSHWNSLQWQLKIYPRMTLHPVPKCMTGSLLTVWERASRSSQELCPWDNFVRGVLTLIFSCLFIFFLMWPFAYRKKNSAPPCSSNSMLAKEKTK